MVLAPVGGRLRVGSPARGGGVEDDALGAEADVQIPQSGVNREYHAQNLQVAIASGEFDASRPDGPNPSDVLRKLDRERAAARAAGRRPPQARTSIPAESPCSPGSLTSICHAVLTLRFSSSADCSRLKARAMYLGR